MTFGGHFVGGRRVLSSGERAGKFLEREVIGST